MSKKFRKVLAAVLAATMVLGSGVVANADEGSGTGEGSLEIVESSDVFDVILPTTAGTTFDYILDPTGVIEETKGEGHGGVASASFASNETMYFRNAPASGSNAPATYSNVSDPITAYNLSTMDVEIKVKAQVATPTGMEIVNTAPASGTRNGYVSTKGTATPSIYLALQPNGGTDRAITTTGIEATGSIPGAPTRYTVTTTMSSANKPQYSKELDATGSNAKKEIKAAPGTPSTVFQSYSFTLTGCCNSDGAWEGVTETPPTVSLVWTIDPPTGVVVGPQVSVSKSGLISVTGLTADQNFDSVTITDGQNKEWTPDDLPCTWGIDNWSATDGGSFTIQLGSEWLQWISDKGGSATVKLILTDGTSKTVTQTF